MLAIWDCSQFIGKRELGTLTLTQFLRDNYEQSDNLSLKWPNCGLIINVSDPGPGQYRYQVYISYLSGQRHIFDL